MLETLLHRIVLETPIVDEPGFYNIDILNRMLPSGSGIDSGTRINEESTRDRIVLDSSYHYMNPDGFYDGWFDFKIIVTPSLILPFELNIEFSNNRTDVEDHVIEMDFADYLCETFDHVLSEKHDFRMKDRELYCV